MGWLSLLSLAKFGFYLGVMGCIGITTMPGFFHRQYQSRIPETFLPSQLRILWATLLVSALGALAVVPLNAGMLLDDGFAGMTDRFMLQMTWESSIGEQARARFIALVMMVACAGWLTVKRSRAVCSWPFIAALGLTAGAIGWSFTQSGHTAAAAWPAQCLIALHVLLAGWWLGSFYPLIRLCQLNEPAPLRYTLHQYGKQAMLWVAGLLLSGGALLLMLILNVNGELNTTYLAVMGIKLVLVGVMLGFAAYHKFRLVAQLKAVSDCVRVKKSIISEALVGLFVLVVTATLTSSFGIAH